jgi:DNA-binding transcriptional ArsR family regulator
MPKKARGNPFAIDGASMVFYQLAIGHTTPKKISLKLGLKPPTVVEHLHQLQDLGVVKLGEKRGKWQHYEINWKKFARAVIEHAPILTLCGITRPPFYPKKEWEKSWGKETQKIKRLKRKFDQLGKNKHFQELVKNYFTMLAGYMDDGWRWGVDQTLFDAIVEFEDAIGRIARLKKKVKDPELSKLFRLLKEWDQLGYEAWTLTPQRVFDEAVEALEKARR